ncbi:PspA/IM30 family protein [Oscillatoria sp. CS-180]|uniref:PspA/IM30 family protein n=1 Tax=Oscillatoria sp. CS-180 TaxID=3021720 RepID=UPI00232DE7BD|nr:PspA/IM30 family protein [Oscillatoria sp. CS-180]MDB9526372.1 PspA/IM30 family protein [Oscillatoria sp. CS-180]
MGVLGRLARIVRSQVNSWVQESEDPEKLLDQAVSGMQSDLIQLRQSVAQAIATQKRTERQCHQTETLAQEWYNRAQLALHKSDELTAREALAQRHAYLKMLSQLEGHVSDQKTVIGRLKTNMRDLEVKIADARTRRDMYIARARSAEASQRIQDMIGQVSSQNSIGVLGQMEDKVLNLEAQADAMAELNQTLESQSLDSKFAALEQSEEDAIEAELTVMRAQLPEK